MKLHDDLGISEDATPEEVKVAHRRVIKKHHPDAGGDRAKFERAQHAYEVLIVPERRRRYEESGDEGAARHVDPDEMARRQAQQTLAQLVVQLALQPQAEFRDLFADAIANIRNGMAQAAAQCAQRESGLIEQAKRLEKMAKRIRRKKGATGEDQVLTIITAQIASFRLEAAQAAEQLKTARDVGERVLSILQEYEFEREKQPPQHTGSFMFSTLSSSSGW